jgi:hypothetical protein
MAKFNLSEMDTYDHAVWRNGILEDRLTPDVARKMTLNDDNDDILYFWRRRVTDELGE